jgi:hypothetical protein
MRHRKSASLPPGNHLGLTNDAGMKLMVILLWMRWILYLPYQTVKRRNHSFRIWFQPLFCSQDVLNLVFFYFKSRLFLVKTNIEKRSFIDLHPLSTCWGIKLIFLLEVSNQPSEPICSRHWKPQKRRCEKKWSGNKWREAFIVIG